MGTSDNWVFLLISCYCVYWCSRDVHICLRVNYLSQSLWESLLESLWTDPTGISSPNRSCRIWRDTPARTCGGNKYHLDSEHKWRWQLAYIDRTACVSGSFPSHESTVWTALPSLQQTQLMDCTIRLLTHTEMTVTPSCVETLHSCVTLPLLPESTSAQNSCSIQTTALHFCEWPRQHWDNTVGDLLHDGGWRDATACCIFNYATQRHIN